jgi:maleate cis-trans isomerase
MRRAVDVLLDEGVDAIVVYGVPLSARRGYLTEREELRTLTAGRGAVPIISSLGAAAEGFRARGARAVLAITQYADDVNEKVATFLRLAGVGVVGTQGLGARNAAEVNALGADDFERLTLSALADHPSADAIFLGARGNLYETAHQIEGATGLPVVEHVSASLDWVLSLFGATRKDNG